MTKLRAPFPWYGGKSLAAPLIWRAFGDVPNYVEPFAGSLATLLARPNGAGKVETANDKDGLIANFWRATKHQPELVAEWADWPVNEADLHARHRWLVAQVPELLEKLIADPEYSDSKIAGWWVWGICAWIGNGWCAKDERLNRARPMLSHDQGVHAQHMKMPRNYRGLTGVHATTLHSSLPALGDAGRGVHAPSRKKPVTNRSKGVHHAETSANLLALFVEIGHRLRNVRICCGDWRRVVGDSTLGIDARHGMTPCAVLLDPPYDQETRDKRLYREDAHGISADVRAWALEYGEHPELRIALCGWEGEHDMPSSWQCVPWKSKGSTANRAKERIWFSPHCLRVDMQTDLFAEVA